MKHIQNVELRKAMLDYGLNQRDLAGLLGVSETAVSKQLARPLTKKARRKYWQLLSTLAEKNEY